MRRNERIGQKGISSALLLPVLAVLAYLLLIWSLSKPLLGWYFSRSANETGLLSAVRFNPQDDRRQYLLGRYYHLNLTTPDPGRAIGQYRQSVHLNPLNAPAWIDLSKAYQMIGKDSDAERALSQAVRLKPNDADLLWEAGIFWLNLGMTDKAVAALKQTLLILPDRQNPVYDLCWKLGLGNDYLLDNLVPGSYPYQSRYLLYLIGTRRIAEAQEAWLRLDKDSLEQSVFISYINFLVGNSRYDEAGTVWTDITARIEGMKEHDSFNLIWNPGFEIEILNGGLGWTVREAEGADVFLDDTIRMTGRRSLGISFDGDHNPEITIARQVVRVEPGKPYTLSGFIKTDALTTTNGIIMSVEGHNCTGLYRSTEAVTGTNFWKQVNLDFDAPSGCQAVTVRMRRAKSNKLDNKIGGTAWIDGISLKQRETFPTSSSRKP